MKVNLMARVSKITFILITKWISFNGMNFPTDKVVFVVLTSVDIKLKIVCIFLFNGRISIDCRIMSKLRDATKVMSNVFSLLVREGFTLYSLIRYCRVQSKRFGVNF